MATMITIGGFRNLKQVQKIHKKRMKITEILLPSIGFKNWSQLGTHLHPEDSKCNMDICFFRRFLLFFEEHKNGKNPKGK